MDPSCNHTPVQTVTSALRTSHFTPQQVLGTRRLIGAENSIERNASIIGKM